MIKYENNKISNKIGDIGTKYFGLGISKLIELNKLTLWLFIKFNKTLKLLIIFIFKYRKKIFILLLVIGIKLRIS